MIKSLVRFFLENKLVVWLMVLLFFVWGLMTAPFDFGIEILPRDPVAVDAIPDIGENQQIVFTNWPGRSPQDMEDQVTYPLTTALLGIPGVRSIRSNSMFGFSSIYIIFEEDIEFYWSRSRILEKLNALPPNLLPEGVQPTLGPDATALGQIFWYTLEGRDQEGNPTGGWDLHELRSIQDYIVRYGLSSAEGVSEVASIGGHVKEYQVDVDPQAMKAANVSLNDIMKSLRESNIDIGAQTIEINLVEYFVRGLGYVKSIEDIENSVVKVAENVPIRIGDIARVNIGPANRRGVLDKSGAEAVGGVVVARYGANPLEVIRNVKEKIRELEPGLPSKEMADGTVSQVKIVPFYDRTQLIRETIGTLEEALSLEILITVIVVILMLMNLRASLLVSASLPLAVLMCFIAMRYFGVDANIVALSGIAIAIGTMVDMGIVLTESMVNRMDEAPPGETLLETIYKATVEVASAVITAVATTIISFLPVFTMEFAEGKLFRPLAFTKTFALIASIILAITVIPALAHSIYSIKSKKSITALILNTATAVFGIWLYLTVDILYGAILILLALAGFIQLYLKSKKIITENGHANVVLNIIYAMLVAWLLAKLWMPLGVNESSLTNFLFIVFMAGSLIAFFYVIIHFYENILRFLMRFKALFLLLILVIVIQGFIIFKNTGEEFMPSLDEGSFLLMPTAMPHAGMQENIKNLRLLDMAVTAIPEVEMVVGKAGRVNSALDPAPMSMYENVIIYDSEYKTNEEGHRIRFRYEDGEYLRDEKGQLIPDKNGRYFRQWRDHIQSPDDIWNEIIKAADLPGVTSAPKLQPIETRLIMLQTGMRAPMGIKVRGNDLGQIESFGIELEKHLQEVEGVKDAAVFADRIVGKPYLLIDIRRDIIARHGLTIEDVQRHIQAAVGGMSMSTTVEGRERYKIRVRYPRELRDDPHDLKDIFVRTAGGQQIPLGDLVNVRYEQGAQSIKSEDGFLVGYVLFDRESRYSEVEVVENAKNYLQEQIENGILDVPPSISYRFAGNYEQQVRATKRLSIVLPLALMIIFLILYFHFSSVTISAMVFSGVAIAFAGGFIMIGLYDTSWFMDFSIMGTNMRDLFQIRTINLSVAVWVGFLALFGIATDDGVLVATFLRDSFKRNEPQTIEEVRDAVVEGGLRRVRPAMMTTATTLLALLPVLSSTGRGSDIMLPMAIPTFGGMALQVITMFTVPILFSIWKETSLKWRSRKRNISPAPLILVPLFLFFCPTGSQGQALDVLYNEAIETNREIMSLQKDYEAALEKAPQVSQWPDPELGIGVFPLPVETRLGAQWGRIGLTQMIPRKAVLNAREELALMRAELGYYKIVMASLEVRFQLEQAYFRLYELRLSRNILEQNITILQSLERLVLSNMESGEASAADVLRVNLKLNSLEQQLRILEEKEAGPLSKINALRDKPASTPVTIPNEYELALIPDNKDSLISYIREYHPRLKLLEMEKKISEKSIELNLSESKPDFGLGLDYIYVHPRGDAMPAGNGRDILQLRATIRLPFNKSKYEAREREELLRIESAEHLQEEWMNRYESIIIKAISDYRIALMEYDLYNEQIEIASGAIDVLESDYSSGADKFDELIALEMDLVQYDLLRLEAIVKSHLAISEIRSLMNVSN